MTTGTTAQRHRIACPYCRIGGGILVIMERGGEVRAEGLNAIRCDTCHRHFRVRARVTFVGMPLDAADPDRRVLPLAR